MIVGFSKGEADKERGEQRKERWEVHLCFGTTPIGGFVVLE